jgi:hypothetical protein
MNLITITIEKNEERYIVLHNNFWLLTNLIFNFFLPIYFLFKRINLFLILIKLFELRSTSML